MKAKCFLICLTVLFGCRSLKEAQYAPVEKGYQLLPPLSYECTLEYTKFSLDKIQEKEFMKHIEDEFSMNVIKSGDNIGRIAVKAELYSSFKLYGPLISGGTLFLGNLIGLPYVPFVAKLELTASIYDSNNKYLSKYTSSGSGKGTAALYWGYSARNAVRKSYLMAAKSAVDDLEKKIQQDYTNLCAKLNSASSRNLVANNTTVPVNTVSYVSSDVDNNIPETGSKADNRYALIVGNEDYSSFQEGLNKEVNVSFAEKDASVFKEYAIKTLGIPSENILFKTNARTVEMNKLIEQMNGIIKNSGGDTEIYIYYAGHGFPDMSTQEPYLIPVDCSGTDLKYAVSLNHLYDKLTEFPSKKVLVFLDACFSGGARNQGLLAARGVKVKPKQDAIKGNLIIFSATNAEQSALSYKDKGHGMFTYFLLKKLQEDKGNSSCSELSEYIQKQVGVKSVLVNALEQNPQTSVSPEIENSWKSIKIR